MKIMKLGDGRWEWMLRFTGMVGQENGFAPSRIAALADALKRWRELCDVH